MSKYGVLVMGPAGAGKSTFCSALITHLRNNRRSCFYVNLDPAAEEFTHEPDLDIKDLISLEDVMEEMGLGPNGGLIYCFEFLLENLDFLTEALDPLSEEYLIVIDMPGQIELYTHIPILPALVKHLTKTGEEDVDDGTQQAGESGTMMRGASFKRLNRAVAGLIDSFSMVSYLRLEVQDEDSVGEILSYIDDAIQYHEAQEPREPNDEVEYDETAGEN
ncbi:putative GPN-loop GTPase 3 like protein [Glarea lozoyensis 74030]|uniref:GPN-loop GTPase 3 n=1 Tax=Glarea lozoyensis (strain ATCC 74030 / MF5533) TaxID=1104152 RepID=H0EG81_GLAL7|nr:putative GPN-loop GTPase 3 like protein [Glarea lozoyensis 74030]